VLVMLGDLDPAEALALARRHFDDIPAHAPPPRADVSEVPQTEERRGEVEEKFGPLPAMAIGYTLPARGTPDWYTVALLERVLHGGRAGRVYRRLVLEKQIAVDADGSADFLDTNGPTQMVTRIFHKPEFTPGQTLAAYDEIIGEVQGKGIAAEELEAVKVKFRSDFYSTLEGGMGAYMPRFGLMHCLACLTLFEGDPRRVNTFLDGFLAPSPAQLHDAAQRYLVPRNRAVLLRRPTQKGGAQ